VASKRVYNKTVTVGKIGITTWHSAQVPNVGINIDYFDEHVTVQQARRIARAMLSAAAVVERSIARRTAKEGQA
jgi:hypothetical protein